MINVDRIINHTTLLIICWIAVYIIDLILKVFNQHGIPLMLPECHLVGLCQILYHNWQIPELMFCYIQRICPLKFRDVAFSVISRSSDSSQHYEPCLSTPSFAVSYYKKGFLYVIFEENTIF